MRYTTSITSLWCISYVGGPRLWMLDQIKKMKRDCQRWKLMLTSDILLRHWNRFFFFFFYPPSSCTYRFGMLSIAAWDGISRSGFATSIYLEIDWFFFLGLWNNERLHEDEEGEEERNNRIALRNWQGVRLSLGAVDGAEPSELPRLIYFGGYKGGRKKKRKKRRGFVLV
jgi:hypothetical protein